MGESFEGRTIIIHLKLSVNIRFDAELKKNFLTKSSIKKFQVYIFQKPGFAIVPWQ